MRGQIFVFLQVILKLSLRFIAHLKQKKLSIIKILSSLAFSDHVILGSHILNIFRTIFGKVLFHQCLKNPLADFFSLKFLYIFNLCNQSLYLKYVSANLFFFNFDFCKKKKQILPYIKTKCALSLSVRSFCYVCLKSEKKQRLRFFFLLDFCLKISFLYSLW